MVDVFSDEWLTFEALSRLIPGNPHKNSIHRWTTRGRNGVKLRSVIINGVRCTKREWVNEFFAASELNGPDDEDPRDDKPKPRKSTAKRADMSPAILDFSVLGAYCDYW